MNEERCDPFVSRLEKLSSYFLHTLVERISKTPSMHFLKQIFWVVTLVLQNFCEFCRKLLQPLLLPIEVTTIIVLLLHTSFQSKNKII